MSASILRFPRQVPRCEHCGWLVPRGSATESIHHEICILPRQRAARLAACREQWRQKARARPAPRPATARPPRRPLPPREPHKSHGAKLLALRIGLDWPEYRERLTEATRLPLDALERVADGRSTMAPTLWRRVLAVLD